MMTEQERIETEIRKVLATESSAIRLSNKLFSPEGLFNQVARTAEDRRAVIQTSLFREAQKKLAELREREAAEFARAVDEAQVALPAGEYRLRVEPIVQT
jgi:hypothetical protein